MRLYIETMDAVLTEFRSDGTVRLENEDWKHPSLQERRAIIHAARGEIDTLHDLITALENPRVGH